MSAPLRNTAAAAVAALLVTGLAACGSGGDSNASGPFGGDSTSTSTTAPATDATTADSAATSAGTTAAVGSTISSDQMQQILSKAVSSISTAHMTMDMDMSPTGQQMHVTAQGDLQYSPLAESMTMDMGSMKMQMLLVDSTMYMKSSAIPSGGKWVKIDMKDMGSLGGTMSSAMSDPLSMLDKMGPYIHNATYVGSDTVNGGAAKHYRISVDVAGMMKSMGMPTSPSVQLPKSADEDLWIDDQGRAVKTQVDMGSMESMTMVMSDFGKSVDIQAPPAGQVTQMSSLGGLGG